MDSFALIVHEAYAIVNCPGRFADGAYFPFQSITAFAAARFMPGTPAKASSSASENT